MTESESDGLWIPKSDGLQNLFMMEVDSKKV